MPTYSTSIILCMVLQIISSLLLGALLYSLLISKNHFTKWTLFQVCVSTFVNNTSRLVLSIISGDGAEQASTKSTILVLRMIASFMFFPLVVFPSVVAFYLWYALVKGDMKIEKRCIYYVSTMIWVYAATHIFVSLVEILKGKIYIDESLKFYSYFAPILVVTLFAIAISCHSSIILWKRWRCHSSRQSRTTAIKLGHATRLFTFSFLYIVILLSRSIPQIINFNSGPESAIKVLSFITNFASASLGVVLFSIFGTSKKAAIFLPCCYYVPPTLPTPHSSFIATNAEHVTTIMTLPTAVNGIGSKAVVKIMDYVPTSPTIERDNTERGFKLKFVKDHKIARSYSRDALAVQASSTMNEDFGDEATSADSADYTLSCSLKSLKPVKKKNYIDQNILVMSNENTDDSMSENNNFINFYFY